MPRALLFLAIIGLVVYAVADIVSSDDDERLGVPAFGWIVIVILVPVLGALVWIVVSRSQRARRAAGTGTSSGRGATIAGPMAPGARRPAGQPVAPDDDPEFLWLLEQARIKKQREEQERLARGEGGTPAGPGPEADPGTAEGSRGEDSGDDERLDPDDVPGAGPRG
jgi:hypothetical protein